MNYIANVGSVIGQSDDSTIFEAPSADEAMRLALNWASASWPESDGGYHAVVWIEDDEGNVLASEDVEISKDGYFSRILN